MLPAQAAFKSATKISIKIFGYTSNTEYFGYLSFVSAWIAYGADKNGLNGRTRVGASSVFITNVFQVQVSV